MDDVKKAAEEWQIRQRYAKLMTTAEAFAAGAAWQREQYADLISAAIYWQDTGDNTSLGEAVWKLRANAPYQQDVAHSCPDGGLCPTCGRAVPSFE